ncbi:MAG: hypothetical protein BGP11_21335 [Rhodobacterales bacterium 65-51]|uniref:sulfite exporter TauE/SafE family protein n=1 Tax=uncultured Gemmobacter sp. TaxID=1095917 RepID=UPI000962D9C2|nr:sulfite exporter TauE/SafE family protein [uncultured Gemmobacter sp.]OJY33433.1 MAG: hypothetical protein BGP11_21335 [Rhodobacterales bacterium 65-51]
MDFLMAGQTEAVFWAAMVVTLFAGFVKGAIGFAMPMIMISAFSSFLPPELALAGLILPTVVANLGQAFRQGWQAALESCRAYWRMITATVVFIVISAQFVRVIPQDLFLFCLGLPITLFALVQLAGRSLALNLHHRNRAEWAFGMVGGLYGGISGVWGPPVLVFLLSVGADKREMVRVQGVIFLIGAVVLTTAHLQSGVLNARTLPFSMALILPSVLGMVAGQWVQDRLDQQRFRWWTLVLLVLTGANLMRRAIM